MIDDIDHMIDDPLRRITDDCVIGENTYLGPFLNLYGCVIGQECRIGAFVEIQRGVVVGNRCKVSSFTFVCSGVMIGDECFIGHGVMFTNDRHPVATREGRPTQQSEEEIEPTIIGEGVSIGSNATILPVTIGAGARIGAGAVVTKNVPAGETWVGNPAHRLLKEGPPLHLKGCQSLEELEQRMKEGQVAILEDIQRKVELWTVRR